MSFFEHVNEIIAKFRSTLNDASETARSIDRNDAWSRLFKIARQEGHVQLIAAIEEICKEAKSGRSQDIKIEVQPKLGYFKAGNALPVA